MNFWGDKTTKKTESGAEQTVRSDKQHDLGEKKQEEKARHARKNQMVLSSKKLSCDLDFGRHDQTTLPVESKDQMFLALVRYRRKRKQLLHR